MSNKIIDGGLTQNQIDQLKKEKGNNERLTLITVHVEGDPLYLWFKKADMNTLSAAASIADSDPMGSAMVYFDNCLIKGDALLVKSDTDIWMEVARKLQTIFKKYDTEVKNF